MYNYNYHKQKRICCYTIFQYFRTNITRNFVSSRQFFAQKLCSQRNFVLVTSGRRDFSMNAFCPHFIAIVNIIRPPQSNSSLRRQSRKKVPEKKIDEQFDFLNSNIMDTPITGMCFHWTMVDHLSTYQKTGKFQIENAKKVEISEIIKKASTNNRKLT